MRQEDCVMEKIKKVLLENGTAEAVLFTLILMSRFLWNSVYTEFVTPTGRDVRCFRYFMLFTFFLAFGLLAGKMICRLFTGQWNKPANSSVVLTLFILMVLISSYVNYGNAMFHEESIYMNLLETMLVTLCFYHYAKEMKEERVQSVLTVNGYFILVLVFLLSALSLGVYFFAGDSFTLFGRAYQKMDLINIGHGETNRYYGFFGYPTVAGFRVMLAAVLSLHLVQKKKLPVIFAAGMLVIAAVVIVLADARSGMILFALTMVFVFVRLLVTKAKMTAKKAVMTMMIPAVFCVLAVLVIKRDAVLGVLSAFAGNSQADAEILSSRGTLISECVRMGLEKPLTGFGWHAGILYLDNSHNLFANLLAWTGFVGLGLFLVFLIFALKEAYGKKSLIPANPYLLCLLLCVFIQANLDKAILGEMHNPETYLFWLCLGLFALGTQDSKREREGKPS